MSALTTPNAVQALVEAGCLAADPVPWLLASAEPFAIWATLHGVFGLERDEPEVRDAHAKVLADSAVAELIDGLPSRLSPSVADHHSPTFVAGRLVLLAEMGLERGDSPRIDALLETLIATQDSSGRFRPRGTTRQTTGSASPRCEHNAITEVLLRYDLGDDPRVARAVKRLLADVRTGGQGPGWCCVPSRTSVASVMRRLDVCPQIELEGLRVLATLDAAHRPRTALDAARTPLEVWRRRPDERPYQFGHGYQFKTVRWPSYWYDVLGVLDTVGRYPELWRGPHATEADRTAIAEFAACLIAYNIDGDGRVTPRRVQRGYEQFSFGDKSAPSPFATARALTALARVAELADRIAAVDVEALASSAGGSGTAIPPTASQPADTACLAPVIPVFDPERVLARVLTRHHLASRWEQQSPESIVSDIVSLTATDPLAPYHSLAARVANLDTGIVEAALDERHSLVRWRGMRGLLMALRRDMVPIVHAATSRQVIRYARDFAQTKGVDSATYSHWAPLVLEACAGLELTRAELRDRLRPPVDLGAVLTVMTAEGLLVRVKPQRGRADRRMRFAPCDEALPGLELGKFSLDGARAQLLRAYVRGYGPVTRRDAAWWTGMDLKRVDRAVRMLEDELLEIGLKGREGTWLMHAADADELERAAFVGQSCVTALPANDSLMLGYADRSRFLDDVARPYVFDTVNNSAPTILVDGRVVAVWDIPTARSGSRTEAASAQALVFPVAPIGDEASEQVADAITRVVTAGGFFCTGTRVIGGMRPLDRRPLGAFAHPLRK